MTYNLVYTDKDGNKSNVLSMADDIYQDILNMIASAKEDRDVLVAITDFLPADINDAFRKRMDIVSDE